MSMESVWKALIRVYVREGRPGRSACLASCYGSVAGCMGAGCVQGERTHRTGPADTKKPTLIRFPGLWELTGDFYALRARCVYLRLT